LGDAFSDHALEAFLPHLLELGWLIEEPAGTSSAYRIPNSLPDFDGAEAVEESEAKLTRLFVRFVEYFREICTSS
jgi:hypothetical protein